MLTWALPMHSEGKMPTCKLELHRGNETVDLIGSLYQLVEGTLAMPAPEPDAIWTESQGMRHGAELLDVTFPNREIAMQLQIRGTGIDDSLREDAIIAGVVALRRILYLATQRQKLGRGPGVTLHYQWSTSNYETVFDVLSGELTTPDPFGVEKLIRLPDDALALTDCALRLVCKPFGRLAEDLEFENFVQNGAMLKARQTWARADSSDSTIYCVDINAFDWPEGDVVFIDDGQNSQYALITGVGPGDLGSLTLESLDYTFKKGAIITNLNRAWKWNDLYEATATRNYAYSHSFGVSILVHFFFATGYVQQVFTELPAGNYSLIFWCLKADDADTTFRAQFLKWEDDDWVEYAGQDITGLVGSTEDGGQFERYELVADGMTAGSYAIRFYAPEDSDPAEFYLDSVMLLRKNVLDELDYTCYAGSVTGCSGPPYPYIYAVLNYRAKDNRYLVSGIPGDGPASCRLYLSRITGPDNMSWQKFSLSSRTYDDELQIEQRYYLPAAWARELDGDQVPLTAADFDDNWPFGFRATLTNTSSWAHWGRWRVPGDLLNGYYRLAIYAYDHLSSSYPDWQSRIEISTDEAGENVIYVGNTILEAPRQSAFVMGYGPFSLPPVGLYAEDLEPSDYYIHLYTRREEDFSYGSYDVWVFGLFILPIDEAICDLEVLFDSVSDERSILLDGLADRPAVYSYDSDTGRVMDPMMFYDKLPQLAPKVSQVLYWNLRYSAGQGALNGNLIAQPRLVIRPHFLDVGRLSTP